MHIAKIGHCCFVIDLDGVRLLTDPGEYTSMGEVEKYGDFDAVLITHEHKDHLHVPSVKHLLEKNSFIKVITNRSVAEVLHTHDVQCSVIGDGETHTIKGVSISAVSGDHAPIHASVAPVENTGFLIGESLFLPGDAWLDPRHPVDVLLLPVAGPWLSIGDAISYAQKIRPKVCIPCHDGMLQEGRMGPVHRLPKSVLEKDGIRFIVMGEGDTYEKDF